MKKAAIITGATGSLGLHIAHYLAQKNHDLIIHYHTSEQAAETLAEELGNKYNIKCLTLKQDLRKTKDYGKLISIALEKLPHINLLINNASIFKKEAFLDTNFDTFFESIKVNLIAPFFLTQAFAKQAKQGCVINILDAYIQNVHSPYFVYMISKKALAIFTEMAAKEINHIRINAICPHIIIPKNKLEESIPKRTNLHDLLEIIWQAANNQYQNGEIIFL
jgi:pteridine reductase